MFKTTRIICFIFHALLVAGCAGPKFHVKVIDQHDNPVSDVNLRVGSLTSHFLLVVSSQIKFYKTDENGRFELGGPRVNVGLIQKNGYEFENAIGFGSTSIYGNYNNYGDQVNEKLNNSHETPYYILAWKRDKPESLIGVEGDSGFSLLSSDSYYEIDFTDIANGAKKKSIDNFNSIGKTNAILLVRYKETGKIILNMQGKERHSWELTLTVPQGGLSTTEDIIRNIAPEEGYESTWTLRSDDLPHVDWETDKKFYIKSKSGKVYGQFSLRFRPSFKTLSFKSYWLNPNGSRNLTRPKKYVYCNNRYLPRDCSLDDYGP